MTDLEKQLRKTILIAEKKGLVLAVEFLRGFIQKEKACKTCVHRLNDHDEVPCDSCDDKSEWQQAPERNSTYPIA
jgi:hypothetical protein